MDNQDNLTELAKFKKDVEAVRDYRETAERQWIINIAFLHGIQHFELERRPKLTSDDRILWEFKNIERKKKGIRTSNYCLPLFRSMLSKFVMMKQTVEVEPTTNADKDQNAARTGNEVAEDIWQTVNKNDPSALARREVGMPLILGKLAKYFLSLGHGYLIPEFDQKVKSSAYLNKEIVPDAEIGELAIKVKSPFQMFVDRYHRWFVYVDRLPVDVIEERWGKKVDPEPENQDSAEARMMSILNDGANLPEDKDAADVYTRYEAPSKKNPKGRKVVYTGKLILEDGELPSEYKNRLPLFDFRYLDFLFSPFAQGFMDQLISLQEEYNFTISQISKYKKLPGKMLAPRGSNMSVKYDDEVGQIVSYAQGNKPSYEPGATPPAYLFEDLVRIRKDMEDVASTHDASQGRRASGVTSGVGMETLRDLDDSQVAPELKTIEAMLGLFVDMCLTIIAEKYSEPRVLSIVGENKTSEVASFVGSDLIGNRRIKVTLGSGMPTSKQGRQDFIFNMVKMGIIDKDKAKDLLEFGDVDGIWNSLDKQSAKQENINLTKDGVIVKAEPWEDHTTHLKVHQDFMKSSQFERASPPVQEKFRAHVGEHQEFLTAEAQAAGAMGGPKQ